jgi:hypothetical protein
VLFFFSLTLFSFPLFPLSFFILSVFLSHVLPFPYCHNPVFPYSHSLLPFLCTLVHSHCHIAFLPFIFYIFLVRSVILSFSFFTTFKVLCILYRQFCDKTLDGYSANGMRRLEKISNHDNIVEARIWGPTEYEVGGICNFWSKSQIPKPCCTKLHRKHYRYPTFGQNVSGLLRIINYKILTLREQSSWLWQINTAVGGMMRTL